MTRRVWQFPLDGNDHVVELDHGFFSGRKEIRIDGAILPLPAGAQSLADSGGDYPFVIGPHQGVVSITTNGITYQYHCSIDGRAIEPSAVAASDSDAHQRQLARLALSGCAVVGGALLMLPAVGGKWSIYGVVPLPYFGALLVLVGVLGLLGVNVFVGGPLDKRNDP